MLFEIHTPTDEIITLKHVPSVTNAILATKGYANAHKCNLNSLVLCEVTVTGKEQIDLSSYNFNKLKRERTHI